MIKRLKDEKKKKVHKTTKIKSTRTPQQSGVNPAAPEG